ncbi:hypothetical protein QFZ75_008045 [Streptomyces sp. V3I8]|uniref:hypothetical protein n=1 Tax=Streptomyces sp. V3I8 TaxID=3042279 RepID=UPI0027866435|nr:hypothetical protein [Streptomyces sp. V3I8]MDQ1041543.1 hypothetical protein [Streptomyces sp. V3I8]
MTDTGQKSLDERYPEHAKQSKIIDKSQAVFEFLEWAQEKEFLFGQEIKSERLTASEGADSAERHAVSLGNLAQDSMFFREVSRSELEKLVAEHFGINLTVIEAEKQQMLEDLRSANR